MTDRSDSRYPHHNTPTPIAGVVLLVGIALFVGSIAVVFLLDLGTGATTVAPIAAVDFQFNPNATGLDDFGRERGTSDGLLRITVTDGETIPADRLRVTGVGDRPTLSWTDSSRYGPGSDVAAGSQLSVWVDRDDPVAVVWVAADRERSAIIREWNGPDS